jgi:hypothetical protein
MIISFENKVAIVTWAGSAWAWRLRRHLRNPALP